MFFDVFNKKGQGALEYLLIIAGAILVSAIIISLMLVSSKGGGEDLNEGQDKYQGLVEDKMDEWLKKGGYDKNGKLNLDVIVPGCECNPNLSLNFMPYSITSKDSWVDSIFYTEYLDGISRFALGVNNSLDEKHVGIHSNKINCDYNANKIMCSIDSQENLKYISELAPDQKTVVSKYALECGSICYAGTKNIKSLNVTKGEFKITDNGTFKYKFFIGSSWYELEYIGEEEGDAQITTSEDLNYLKDMSIEDSYTISENDVEKNRFDFFIIKESVNLSCICGRPTLLSQTIDCLVKVTYPGLLKDFIQEITLTKSQ